MRLPDQRMDTLYITYKPLTIPSKLHYLEAKLGHIGMVSTDPDAVSSSAILALDKYTYG